MHPAVASADEGARTVPRGVERGSFANYPLGKDGVEADRFSCSSPLQHIARQEVFEVFFSPVWVENFLDF